MSIFQAAKAKLRAAKKRLKHVSGGTTDECEAHQENLSMWGRIKKSVFNCDECERLKIELEWSKAELVMLESHLDMYRTYSLNLEDELRTHIDAYSESEEATKLKTKINQLTTELNQYKGALSNLEAKFARRDSYGPYAMRFIEKDKIHSIEDLVSLVLVARFKRKESGEVFTVSYVDKVNQLIYLWSVALEHGQDVTFHELMSEFKCVG